MKKTSLKIMSAKAETTEIKLRTVSKHIMALIKVIGNQKTSLKIILPHAETAETTEIQAENGLKTQNGSNKSYKE